MLVQTSTTMTPRKAGVEQEFSILRRVVPQVPMKEEDVEMLREDLQRMSCAGLLFVSWGFQEEEMVRELMRSPPSRYHKTPRAHLETWTKRTWQRVYGFRLGGSGLTTRKEEFAKDLFEGKIDAKEGYRLADCKDRRARAILAFLIPVFIRTSRPESPRHGRTRFWEVLGRREPSTGASSWPSLFLSSSRAYPSQKGHHCRPTSHIFTIR